MSQRYVISLRDLLMLQAAAAAQEHPRRASGRSASDEDDIDMSEEDASGGPGTGPERPWHTIHAADISSFAKNIHQEMNDRMVDALRVALDLPDPIVQAMRKVWRGIFLPGVLETTASIQSEDELAATLSDQQKALLSVSYDPDTPFRHRGIHLSSTSIYASVLKSLNLKPGQSFLHVGSGSGYLSSMVAELIAPSRVHHGADVSIECIRFCHSRVRTTLTELHTLSNAALHDLTHNANFVVGNAFLMAPPLSADGSVGFYDRIYCGAAVADEDKFTFFYKMLRIGGVLVFPMGHHFCKVTRLSDGTVKREAFLTVTFADLQEPSDIQQECSPRFVFPGTVVGLGRSRAAASGSGASDGDDDDDDDSSSSCSTPSETGSPRSSAQRAAAPAAESSALHSVEKAMIDVDASGNGNGSGARAQPGPSNLRHARRRAHRPKHQSQQAQAVLRWSVEQVQEWIRQLFPQDSARFEKLVEENQICGMDLLDLTSHELFGLGIRSLRERRIVISALRNLVPSTARRGGYARIIPGDTAATSGGTATATATAGVGAGAGAGAGGGGGIASPRPPRWEDVEIDYDKAPAEFCCPITAEVMRDPVVTADGHTYERAAIQSWFSSRNTDPMTNLVVLDKSLIPNLVLRKLIHQYLATLPRRSTPPAAAPSADAIRPDSATTAPSIDSISSSGTGNNNSSTTATTTTTTTTTTAAATAAAAAAATAATTATTNRTASMAP